MTTFEQTVIYLLIIITVLLGFIVFCVWNYYRDTEHNNYMLRKKLDNIDTNTATSVSVGIDLKDIVDKMHRNLCVEIADKMVDRVYPDKELMNKIDWDKLSKEQQDEFLKRLIMPNYDSPFQPPFNPTCETTNKED